MTRQALGHVEKNRSVQIYLAIKDMRSCPRLQPVYTPSLGGDEGRL